MATTVIIALTYEHTDDDAKVDGLLADPAAAAKFIERAQHGAVEDAKAHGLDENVKVSGKLLYHVHH